MSNYKNALRKLTFAALVATVFALAASLATTPEAEAGVSPLALAIVPPVQIPPSGFTVVGARISAGFGQHRDMLGLDLGVVGNITDNSFAGIGVSGIFNYNRGMTTAVLVQAAGITNVNINKARIIGVQFASVLNANYAESSVVGFQLALGNHSPFTKVYGAQLGIYNRANHVYGFQIGLINFADTLHGIQIGLANFNKTGLFSFAPFLNVGF